MSYDNCQTQIRIINVETTFETHLSSCKVFVSSKTSQHSDGEKNRGKEETLPIFFFFLALPNHFTMKDNQTVSEVTPFVFGVEFTALLNDLYNPQGSKMMLCLHEQFYSLEILRHPQGGLGAGLVFIGNYFSLIKQNKNSCYGSQASYKYLSVCILS